MLVKDLKEKHYYRDLVDPKCLFYLVKNALGNLDYWYYSNSSGWRYYASDLKPSDASLTLLTIVGPTLPFNIPPIPGLEPKPVIQQTLTKPTNMGLVIIAENKTSKSCVQCGGNNKAIDLFRTTTYYCPKCETV